ncbi:MAG: hypothetical protein VB016_00385 [Methanomassiliicoccaceae archaeon]|nr:hypothetical protein [Methanomassiliicoccaceae archaeon]
MGTPASSDPAASERTRSMKGAAGRERTTFFLAPSLNRTGASCSSTLRRGRGYGFAIRHLAGAYYEEALSMRIRYGSTRTGREGKCEHNEREIEERVFEGGRRCRRRGRADRVGIACGMHKIDE